MPPIPSSPAPADRSIGRFLCHHPLTPPVEDTDRLPWQDIKQDACLRALVALRRAGKPTGPDPVAAFDAEPRLVRAAYHRAYRDALRRHLGRQTAPDRRAARWQRLVSLDRGLAEIADPRQGEALDEVLATMAATARLLAASHSGIAGLPPAQTRRLIRVLRHAQRLQEEGTTVVPPTSASSSASSAAPPASPSPPASSKSQSHKSQSHNRRADSRAQPPEGVAIFVDSARG